MMTARFKSFLVTCYFAFLITIAAFNLVSFSGNWGGDPEIHIIFAKNFLQGNFLEFNPGFKTSGETSILYMIFIASLLLLIPIEYIWLLMSFTGLIALLALLVYFINFFEKKPISYLICLYVISIPSIFFQAFLGMENMLFALWSILFASKFIFFQEGGIESKFRKN